LALDEYTEREKAFESIVNYCDKVQFLYLYEIGKENIHQVFKLITHVSRHLKYLTLQSNEHNVKIILPDSLKYLDLCFAIDQNDLKIFLDNCKHIRLDDLLVQNYNLKNVDITFRVLKEFVEEKKLKKFAYHI